MAVSSKTITNIKNSIFSYAADHGQVGCYSGAVKAVASRKNTKELNKLISQLQAILADSPNLKSAARSLRACIRLQDYGWSAPIGRGGYVAEIISGRAKRSAKPATKRQPVASPKRQSAQADAALTELEALRAENAKLQARLAEYEPAVEPEAQPVWPESIIAVCTANVKALRAMAGEALLSQTGSKSELQARIIEGMNAR